MLALFYSNGGQVRPHIHAENRAALGKWWPAPSRLAWQSGFITSQLRGIERVVSQRSVELPNTWIEHFQSERGGERVA